MFTMKILTLSALLCAMMTLTRAHGHPVANGSTDCLCGWTPYNNNCLIVILKPMTWADAQKNCQSMDANLASVRNDEEHRMIQKFVFTATYMDRPAWIGGSDAQQEGSWFWIDGTPFKYTNWGAGQPNNHHGHQHCLQLNTGDKKWDDVRCNVAIASVCVKNLCKRV